MNEPLVNFSAPDTRSWYKRMKGKLFPSRRCLFPETPGEWSDLIYVVAITEFGWADRIRLLFSGVLVTHGKIATEKEAGGTASSFVCYPGTRDDVKGNH